MKSIVLTTLFYFFFTCTHIATASPSGPLIPRHESATGGASNNPTIIYSQSPEYLRALLKRVRENRRSADEDTLDMYSITITMRCLKYSPQTLGTTEEELSMLLRKVCIKSIKYSLQQIESGKLNEEDRQIEVGVTRDVIKIYEISLNELGITRSKLEALLK